MYTYIRTCICMFMLDFHIYTYVYGVTTYVLEEIYKIAVVGKTPLITLLKSLIKRLNINAGAVVIIIIMIANPCKAT